MASSTDTPEHAGYFTLQSAATANGNGTSASLEGYDGAKLVEIQNGAGTCTVTLQGSLDPAFTSAQDIETLAVIKLSDSGAGDNLTRSVISGAITVAANTTSLYALQDALPYVRAVISSAAALGAGTTDTGCTVKVYALPV